MTFGPETAPLVEHSIATNVKKRKHHVTRTSDSVPALFLLPPTSTKKTQQTVQFNDDAIQIIEPEIYLPYKEERQEIWWQKRELEAIRIKTKLLAKQIAKNPNLNIVDSHNSYTNLLERVYRKSLQNGYPSMEDKKGLALWVQHGHSRRGLERYSNDMGYDRNQRRDGLVAAILSLQKSSSCGSSYESELKNILLLRRTSRHFSKPAIVFAEAMAEADAKAAARV